MVERWNELVALVADVGGTIAERRGLHHNPLIAFALAFVGVQDLGKRKKGSSIFTGDSLKNFYVFLTRAS